LLAGLAALAERRCFAAGVFQSAGFLRENPGLEDADRPPGVAPVGRDLADEGLHPIPLVADRADAARLRDLALAARRASATLMASGDGRPGEPTTPGGGARGARRPARERAADALAGRVLRFIAERAGALLDAAGVRARGAHVGLVVGSVGGSAPRFPDSTASRIRCRAERARPGDPDGAASLRPGVGVAARRCPGGAPSAGDAQAREALSWERRSRSTSASAESSSSTPCLRPESWNGDEHRARGLRRLALLRDRWASRLRPRACEFWRSTTPPSTTIAAPSSSLPWVPEKASASPAPSRTAAPATARQPPRFVVATAIHLEQRTERRLGRERRTRQRRVRAWTHATTAAGAPWSWPPPASSGHH